MEEIRESEIDTDERGVTTSRTTRHQVTWRVGRLRFTWDHLARRPILSLRDLW